MEHNDIRATKLPRVLPLLLHGKFGITVRSESKNPAG
jgi:hypothetical protein